FYLLTHTPSTNIYTLSLHDALPIFTQSPYRKSRVSELNWLYGCEWLHPYIVDLEFAKTVSRQSSKRIECRCPNPKCEYSKNMFVDRKSTRLNSSHVSISYAVFCLKK